MKLDNSTTPSLRKKELNKVSYKINLRCTSEVTVKLGGETSFDIYPKGWDKTYALRHFKDYACWFVGDRCEGDGNDAEIYNLLLKEGRAFKTTDPLETVSIIKKQILPILKV